MKSIIATKVKWSRASFILAVLSLSYLLSCDQERNTAEYIAEIEHWRGLRIDSLKGKTGYLNLAGLFWLEEGVNSIGSDSSNNFIFPPKAPPRLGQIILKGDSVWIVKEEKELFITDDTGTDTLLIYAPELPTLSMRYKDLSWYIISRGEDYGIRLKDYNHPLIESFNHIENYPIEEKFKVEANWETYAKPKMVLIKNQVGMDLLTPIYGVFHFELMGEQYTLEPTSPLESDSYFTMIFDQTSGESTYGSGRYIDVPRPDENGVAYIDFNKAYNPPCAFTEFATCTFPHAANRLPIRIEAGEKYSRH